METSECPFGSREASSSENSFQFINLNESLKIGECSRALIRSRATWSSYHPAEAVVVHKTDRSKQMSRFKLQPYKLAANLETFLNHQEDQLGSVEPHRSQGRKSEVPHTPLSGNQSTPDEPAAVETQMIAVESSINHGGTEMDFRKHREVVMGISSEGLYPNPSNAAVNPFNVLPLPISVHENDLLKHFFAGSANPSLMMRYRISWAKNCLDEPAMLNCILSHAPGDHNLSYNRGDPIDSLQYRMEAIKIVNSRLSKREEAVRDGTICCVAGILTYETHMNGLQQLIKMRGGLRNGNLPLILRRVVAWADLTAANTLHSSPRFEASDIANLLQPPPWELLCLGLQECSPNLSALRERNLRAKFGGALGGIFANLWKFPVVGKHRHLIDHIGYSDKIYLTQRSLMDVSYNRHHKSPKMDQACAIAALIYVHIGLCDIRPYSKIVGILVLRLKALLEKVLTEFVAAPYSDHTAAKLIWALYFGGIAAVHRSERQWLVKNLVIVCKVLDLGTWPDIHEILGTIFWKSEWESPVGALWQEIDKYQSASV